jgi:hypothetical protein
VSRAANELPTFPEDEPHYIGLTSWK